MSSSKVTKPMVEKLIKFTNLKKIANDFLITAVKLELAGITGFTEDEKEEITDKCVSSLQLEDYLLPIYQEHFTSEEMLDIIAFFRSKSGQKYVARQQQVSDAVMNVFPKLTLELTIRLASEIGRRRNS